MQIFTTMLKEANNKALDEERKIRYRLAESCLEFYASGNKSGKELYAALSHLAQIPELEINMAAYDNLMFIEHLPDDSIFYRAKVKLLELKELMEVLG